MLASELDEEAARIERADMRRPGRRQKQRARRARRLFLTLAHVPPDNFNLLRSAAALAWVRVTDLHAAALAHAARQREAVMRERRTNASFYRLYGRIYSRAHKADQRAYYLREHAADPAGFALYQRERRKARIKNEWNQT